MVEEAGNDLEGELSDPTKVNLVGGHINQIKIVSDQVLQKKTSLNECQQYLIIFDDCAEAQGRSSEKHDSGSCALIDYVKPQPVDHTSDAAWLNRANKTLIDSVDDLRQHSLKKLGTLDQDRQRQLYLQNKELRSFIPKLISIEPRIQKENKEHESYSKHPIDVKYQQTRQQLQSRLFSSLGAADEPKMMNQVAQSDISSAFDASNDQQDLPHEAIKLEKSNVDRPIIVDYYIKLENLLEGRSSASIIDIKMGTSTVTCNITSERKLKKRHAKDNETTSRKLGIRVIGYVIKSRQKEIEEKFYKFPYRNEQEIPQVLRRLFSWPRCADCRLADKDMSYACSNFLN